MSSIIVVITDVLIQQPSQMSAIQHDHMIPEVSTYTANPALRNSVLPRAAECGANRLAAHRLHSRDHCRTELRVPIKNQEALRLLAVFPSLVRLEGNPKRAGIASHVAVQDLTSIVADHEERAIRICAPCWYRERITSSDHSGPTAICDDGVCGWRNAAARRERNGPSLRPPASWRSCCIGCGSVEKSTNRCAIQSERCRQQLS